MEGPSFAVIRANYPGLLVTDTSERLLVPYFTYLGYKYRYLLLYIL
jgi:hypothetical protein